MPEKCTPGSGIILRRAVVLACFAAAITPASAHVTGTVPSGVLMSGEGGTYSLMLTSELALGAINGELTYDPALLTAPSVAAGAGAAGFTAMGHEMTPGVFRFVLYNEDPEAVLSLASPVLDFSLTAASGIEYAAVAGVDFTIKAAAYLEPGSGNAISVGVGGPLGNPAPEEVDFQSFEILVTRFNDNPVNDAMLISTTAPTQVPPGAIYMIGVNMRNTGTTWWETLTGYSMDVVSDACPLIVPVLPELGIPGEVPGVAPDTIQQFRFQITAPMTEGPCQIRLRMEQDGVGVFGPEVTIDINVVTGANLVTDWTLYQ